MKGSLTCYLHLILLLLLSKRVLSRRVAGRFTNELRFMHCLCSSPTPERLQRISCMENFVSPHNSWRMHQSVQYCSYFAHKTRFGETIRQRQNIPDYNPWKYSPDLNTGIACGYTRIQPGQYATSNLKEVTHKGWIISKCILNMAQIYPEVAKQMNQYCCG